MSRNYTSDNVKHLNIPTIDKLLESNGLGTKKEYSVEALKASRHEKCQKAAESMVFDHSRASGWSERLTKWCITCNNESDVGSDACQHCGADAFETPDDDINVKPDIWFYERETIL